MTVLLYAIFQGLVYPSIAIGVVACTITKSKMFGWLREYTTNWWFIGGLLKCPYCLAHWLSFGTAALVQLSWSDHVVVDWFIQSMVLVGLSTATVRLQLETYFGFEA